jgi:hypothetical protein
MLPPPTRRQYEASTSLFLTLGGKERMRVTNLACTAAVSALVVCCISDTANSQTCAAPKASQAYGVTVSITDIHIAPKKVIIEFTAKNNTKGRVYIVNTWEDEKAILSTGDVTNLPTVNGIQQCNQNLSNCSADSRYRDVMNMSYMESGEPLVFLLSYDTPSSITQDERMSFILPMIMRIEEPNSPDHSKAGNPLGARFNFPNVQLQGQC